RLLNCENQKVGNIAQLLTTFTTELVVRLWKSQICSINIHMKNNSSLRICQGRAARIITYFQNVNLIVLVLKPSLTSVEKGFCFLNHSFFYERYGEYNITF